ncbi:hypothetical protein BpHYR1_034200 [Brachionus plicatilis]|uniref:Uncharacterized protein n=1 Tax=Brachionus plicatilis TaxID=10195 RepID=A0A3M7RVS2_BRAPC|nr:hypothetical protein BpHYR1_034200 [Brachionus plicatilis]
MQLKKTRSIRMKQKFFSTINNFLQVRIQSKIAIFHSPRSKAAARPLSSTLLDKAYCIFIV